MPPSSISLLNVQMYMPGSSPSVDIEGSGFWIGLYEEERFMHIVPHGVWTVEQAIAYRRALRAATARMVRTGGYKGAVFDGSVYCVQDIEVMRQHAAAMRMARWIFNVKASVYSPHPVAGDQLKAATEEGHQRAFSSSAEAMDWLMT